MKTRAFLAGAAALGCLSMSAPLSSVRAGEPAPAARPAAPGPLSDDLAARLGRLTLDDAIDIALHRNPDILRQIQEIQRSQGVLITVRSAALPQVVASGNFQQTDRSLLESGVNGTGSSTSALNNIYLPTVAPPTAADPTGVATPRTGSLSLGDLFGGTGSNVNSSDKNYTIQVQVQQAVINFAIPPSIRQAKYLRDAAYYNLRETVDITVNTVKTDFYSVLLDKDLIEIQNENLRLRQSQLTDQQNRYAAGTVARFDVLQASVAVANQRPQVIIANNTLNQAYIGLMRTLGVEYGPQESKRAPLKLVGNLEYRPQNFVPEEGVAAGKANRGALKSQQLTILSNIEQLKIANAGYLPVLTANAGYEAINDRLSDDLGQTLHGWFYGAAFNWNIFDGLATYGRAKQAQAALRASRIAYLDAVNQVVQDIQNNYLTLQQSKELIASQVLNVSEAEEAVRLSQARLSAGTGTQLDVLDSQTQLLAARNTELRARYDYAVALSNYERVTGTSTVYNEAFFDPLTNRREPLGRDSTGVPVSEKTLPLGTIKTPDVKTRGTGQPLPKKINAENPDRAARPAKPLGKRDYLFEE